MAARKRNTTRGQAHDKATAAARAAKAAAKAAEREALEAMSVFSGELLLKAVADRLGHGITEGQATKALWRLMLPSVQQVAELVLDMDIALADVFPDQLSDAYTAGQLDNPVMRAAAVAAYARDDQELTAALAEIRHVLACDFNLCTPMSARLL